MDQNHNKKVCRFQRLVYCSLQLKLGIKKRIKGNALFFLKNTEAIEEEENAPQ